MSSETEDTDQPTILPILRISSHQGTKQQRRDSKKEIKGKIFMYFCDQSQYIFVQTCTAVPSETQNGKICYEDVLHLLTCPTCESYVSTPVIQCKRGQGELEGGHGTFVYAMNQLPPNCLAQPTQAQAKTLSITTAYVTAVTFMCAQLAVAQYSQLF